MMISLPGRNPEGIISRGGIIIRGNQKYGSVTITNHCLITLPG
jgi:hypothetical protein